MFHPVKDVLGGSPRQLGAGGVGQGVPGICLGIVNKNHKTASIASSIVGVVCLAEEFRVKHATPDVTNPWKSLPGVLTFFLVNCKGMLLHLTYREVFNVVQRQAAVAEPSQRLLLGN